MPSPLMHTVVGFFIYRYFVRNRKASAKFMPSGRSLGFLIVVIAFSLPPDMDAILGIWLNDFGRFHNNWSHSLFFGLIVSTTIGALASCKKKRNFLAWFSIALLCYEMHVIMDFFTVGRGVKLFWPLSQARYESPIKFFYGLHWSDGPVSLRHVLTFATEIGLILAVIGIVAFLKKRKQIITLDSSLSKNTR